MVLVADPIGSPLLLLRSERAISLYFEPLFTSPLKAEEAETGFTFLEDSPV